MRIPDLFGKSKSAAYQNVKSELFDIFRKEIEECKLTKHPLINRFLIHKTIIRTHERLQNGDAPTGHAELSEQDYVKILRKTAKEVKRKYVDAFDMRGQS